MTKRFKVFKKLCSLALILSMLVSMIPINVFADTQDADKTIDLSQTGSLTINKQGEDDKEPIEDVTFTIYQILSISNENDILKYKFVDKFEEFFRTVKLTEDQTPGFTVDEVLNMDKSELDIIAKLLKKHIEDYNNNNADDKQDIIGLSKTTVEVSSGDAQAKFEGLNLGYYLVDETGWPGAVITPHDPFFVSVPMSINNIDDRGNVISSEWLYDIVVTPKNKTVYTPEGSLVLVKKDKNNSSTVLAGAKFKLMKVGETNPVIDELTTDNSGKIVIGGLAQGTYYFEETAAPDKYIFNTSTPYKTDNFEVRFDGEKINYIYKGHTKETLEIIATNEKPTVTKIVDDPDVNIGDEVTWTITATVPSTIKELKTFKLIDTLSKGLDYDDSNADNLIVKQGDTTLTRYNEDNIKGDYKVTSTKNETTGKTELVIEFITANLKSSTDINVLYNTTVNENAVIGTEGNPNKVKLEYSTVTGTDSEFDDKPTETPEVEVKVYTFGLKLLKIDRLNEALGGVEFKLYKADGITEVKFKQPASNNPEYVVASDENQDENQLVDVLVTNSQGNIIVKGLEEGTYVLVETKAKDGYNLLKESITLNVGDNEKTINGYYELTVVNNKGFELPTTGGMGTVIFTVAGLGMMGLAGAAYIALKRKESQQ